MILYLCRHGIAEDAGAGQSDADRALTPEGIKKFRTAAKGFAELEPEVSHILTSPLLRARQTAEILVDALERDKKKVELVVCNALGPGANLRGLLGQLHDLRATGAVAVGHEPSMSAFVGELCFGTAGRCAMKKGAIAAIDLDERQRTGMLLYLLQPGQLRRLA